MAIVVDRSQARFINRRPFNVFDTFVNDSGRSKNREFTDDKPGMKGLIRAKLNSQFLEKSVWLNKDLAHFNEHELKIKLNN